MFPGMEDLIAEKLRTALTAVPSDRCELLLEAANFHLGDGDSDRAVAIWKHLITEGGKNADLARLDYAEYLFDEFEDDAAYAELDAVLSQRRIFSKAWSRAVEMIEEREPDIALFLNMLAMEWIDPEYLHVRTVASRYVQFAANCRRLRWQLGIRLTDVDLLAAIGRTESAEKESRLVRLVSQAEVIEGRIHVWERGLFEALHESHGCNSVRQSATYYSAIELALRTQHSRRPALSRLLSADRTRLVQLADSARHVEDLPELVGRYDQGTVVEWPPGRNQPCWCGSASNTRSAAAPTCRCRNACVEAEDRAVQPRPQCHLGLATR